MISGLAIEEFSAKVRSGPPDDDAEDMAFPTWAGVLPLEINAGTPIDDPELNASQAVPDYLKKSSAFPKKMGRSATPNSLDRDAVSGNFTAQAVVFPPKWRPSMSRCASDCLSQRISLGNPQSACLPRSSRTKRWCAPATLRASR